LPGLTIFCVNTDTHLVILTRSICKGDQRWNKKEKPIKLNMGKHSLGEALRKPVEKYREGQMDGQRGTRDK